MQLLTSVYQYVNVDPAYILIASRALNPQLFQPLDKLRRDPQQPLPVGFHNPLNKTHYTFKLQAARVRVAEQYIQAFGNIAKEVNHYYKT